MSGSVWKIRVGDTTGYELTANRTYDSSPAWSPDGRWIVYTADDSANGINLMPLNTAMGESAALTQGNGLNLHPAWSPDGAKLAYVATGTAHVIPSLCQSTTSGQASRRRSPRATGMDEGGFAARTRTFTSSPPGRPTAKS
jgi:Tol biopolymer transport system component